MLKILLLGLLMTTGHAKYTNKLVGEDSPYLLQHAHNPVDWYPWGDEAFAKAKKENKLIFLSIGYSTCHWCHVMEKESFENEEVAKILNKDFISIKVDREEYPHIDRHYQDIYMLMNRRGGGWPLTIVMTPEKKVFFSATYLPPENNHGRSGLKGLLGVLHNAYVNRHDEVQKSADSIEAAMARADTRDQNHKQFLDIGIAETFVKSLGLVFDETYKGFGNAPKFPQATTLGTLLDIYRITKDKTALSMATQTLESMSMGGIYDQIEGGFYRYSVDEEWLIPHFEKMLYTNAELLEAYANAYALSKNPRFKTVIMETMENIDTRFKKEGMYYSASDADSDGEEGKYFVFDFSESLADLKNGGLNEAEAKEILRYYGIERQGNFEHNRTNPFLKILNAPKALERGKAILRANREKKNYAFIDHKIQTSWNALYLKGLFAVSKHVDSVYAKEALKSLDSLLMHLYKDGELYHQMVIGKDPKVGGYLEDYAFLISALIEAYGVGFEEKYLDIAKKLSKNAIAKFYKEGAWYMSDDSFKAKAEFYDASYRSALAVMIENLLKLAALNDDLTMHALAMEGLNAHLAALKQSPNQYPTGLKSYLQSLLSFVVIKSTKENLIQNKAALEGSRYPFLLLKPSADAAFLACKIDACFASEKSLDALLKKIEE